MIRLADLPADLPILIAGPTSSGKSALALDLAETSGGVVINADALQVYDCWQVLTARPGAADLARAPHALYGHIPADRAYSTGDWLRDVIPCLEGPRRPIIVGGTGLYFAALTEGLADIPPTPPDIRAEADARMARDAKGVLDELDAATRARIDTANPARVQRAWEVQRTTGRGLAAWHAETPPPHLPAGRFVGLHIAPPKDWLNARIAARFDAMLSGGAIEETRALRPRWRPDLPAAKAIGAAELMAYLDGRMTLDEVRQRGVILTRQYAKRQRTWFRARMANWRKLPPED